MDQRRPPSPGTVATVLLLRRRAEHVALQDLVAAREQIERWRQALALSQGALSQAEQALRQLRQAGPQQRAGALAQAHESLGLQLGVVRTLGARHAAAAAQVGRLMTQAELLRARLGAAISRREAAELYEARERRERSLRRAQQEASLEQEAADRKARWRSHG